MPSQEIQDPPFKPQFGGFKRIFCAHPDPCEIMKTNLIICFNWLETHQPPTTWHNALPKGVLQDVLSLSMPALYSLGVYPNQVFWKEISQDLCDDIDRLLKKLM